MLLQIARSGDADDPITQYARGIVTELSKSRTRGDTVVHHNVNSGKPAVLTKVFTNSDFPSIDTSCLSSITCDVYYELDWGFRLQKDLTCDEVKVSDLCFASYACICSTGYYRVTADMPAVPAS